MKNKLIQYKSYPRQNKEEEEEEEETYKEYKDLSPKMQKDLSSKQIFVKKDDGN